MLLFIDSEFTDFIDIELISLGIVSEDGQHQFYVEISDYDRGKESTFVQENIVPMLNPSKYGKSKVQAACSLAEWLEELPDQRIIFVADYLPDLQLLQDLLYDTEVKDKKLEAAMIQNFLRDVLHERGVHMPGMIAKAYKKMSIVINNPERGERVHHALDDAERNRRGFVAGVKAGIGE